MKEMGEIYYIKANFNEFHYSGIYDGDFIIWRCIICARSQDFYLFHII